MTNTYFTCMLVGISINVIGVFMDILKKINAVVFVLIFTGGFTTSVAPLEAVERFTINFTRDLGTGLRRECRLSQKNVAI